MTRASRITAFSVAAFLTVLAQTGSTDPQSLSIVDDEVAFRECQGPFKEKKLNQEELGDVLRQHNSWQIDRSAERPDLCGLDLSGVDLSATSSGARAIVSRNVRSPMP